MKARTCRPHRLRPALFAWVAVGVLALTAPNVTSPATAEQPPPSAIEVLKANVATETFLPNPFQLRARLEVDGNQIADLNLGWSGGALVSLRAKLSSMPGFGEIAAALRPSGFALITAGKSSQVLAPLVPYSPILQLLPDLINRTLLADILDSVASSARLAGETVIRGRRAYIVEWTPTPEAIFAAMKKLITRLAAEEEVAVLLEVMGFPLDEALANWDTDIPQIIEAIHAESDLPPLTYRHYIDALDYVTLGYDIDAHGYPERDKLLAVLTPEVELEDITVGADGHIQQLVWRVKLDITPEELDGLAEVLAGAVIPAEVKDELEAAPEAENEAEAQAEAEAEAETEAEPEPEAEADAKAEAGGTTKVEAATGGSKAPAAETQSPAFALDFRITLGRVGQGYLPAEISGYVRIDRAALPLVKSLTPLADETGGSPSPLGVELRLSDPPGPSAEASPEPEEHTFRLTLQWDTTRGAEPALVENSQLLNAERSWKQAQDALEADDWEAAIPPLARLTRQVPSFAYAHLVLSSAYMNTGETWSAIGELEQVVMLQPENWLALNNLAYLYVDHDIDLERGLDLALAAYDLLPDPPPAFVIDTVGWAFYKNGNLEAASWYLEDALILLDDENKAGMYEPEEYAEHAATLHYHLGAVYAARGMYDQAKAHLEASVQHNPDLTEAQELLAEVNEALAEATS